MRWFIPMVNDVSQKLHKKNNIKAIHISTINFKPGLKFEENQ